MPLPMAVTLARARAVMREDYERLVRARAVRQAAQAQAQAQATAGGAGAGC